MTPSSDPTTIQQPVPETEAPPPPRDGTPELLLPLRAGDHLPRDEFEQRYTAMPQLKKAELIEGVVVIPSPVHDTHARPHALLMAWLAAYWVPTPGVDLLDNVSVRLDIQRDVEHIAQLISEQVKSDDRA